MRNKSWEALRCGKRRPIPGDCAESGSLLQAVSRQCSKYSTRAEGGQPITRLIKCLTAILLAACFLSPAAAATDVACSPRIILMCCYQQDGWEERASATFLDNKGYVWRYESAVPLPSTDEARLAFLAETDSVVCVGKLDFWRMLELHSLIESAQPWPLEPQPAKAADFGLNTYSAVRYSADGRAEIIPLAVSGNWMAENPEPNAYALYASLFYEITIHETEDPAWLQPMNIPREPLAAFCGLDETIFDGATLAVSFSHPQLGEYEYALNEDEMREQLDWLAGLVVTCKQNALPYAGYTCAYTLYTPQGERLATFAFFHDLLVTGDGMYAVETGNSSAMHGRLTPPYHGVRPDASHALQSRQFKENDNEKKDQLIASNAPCAFDLLRLCAGRR